MKIVSKMYVDLKKHHSIHYYNAVTKKQQFINKYCILTTEVI